MKMNQKDSGKKGDRRQRRQRIAMAVLACILAALMLLPFGLSSVIHTDFAAIPPHIWWVIAYAVLLPSFGPNYLLIFSLHYV